MFIKNCRLKPKIKSMTMTDYRSGLCLEVLVQAMFGVCKV